MSPTIGITLMPIHVRRLARLAITALPHPRLGSSRRGQSLVEFALVLPMLIVLFLGIADFGRVFAAGITVEGIARNAAEIVAGDSRMAELKDAACDSACRSGLYDDLHQLAASAACDEAKRLNATTDVDGSCAGLLVIGTCVHDTVTTPPGDTCGLVTGGSVPNGCKTDIPATWSNAQNGVDDPTDPSDPELRYVEVRVCYRFTPLFHQIGLPIVSYLVPDQIYLERTRSFTVSMDY